jgi:hypothetical protein
VKKVLKSGNQWMTTILPGRPDMNEAVRQFLEQKATVLVGELSQLDQLQRDAKFKIGIVLPTGTLGWLGTDLVLMKKPAEPKARTKWLFELLDHLYKADTALTFIKAVPGLPVCRTYVEQAAWRKAMSESGGLINDALYRSPQTMAMGKIPPENREEWINVTWNSILGVELKASSEATPAATPVTSAPSAVTPVQLAKEQQATRTAELKDLLENLLRTKSR